MSLTLDHVSYAYPRRGGEPFSVRDASIDIPKGSLTGLLGPNGSGKTTLLKLLGGVIRPGTGIAALDGSPLEAMSRRAVARRLAMVPQETHPAFSYTVMEMVLMGRHPHLGPFQLEGPLDISIARDALEATGSAHLAERSFTTLSGGEKQRVMIASALAQKPDVLLLDEPTASLDLGYQLDVAALLRRLNRDMGVTMVLTTHDLNLAAALCDTVVVVRDGRILARGAAGTILTADTIRRLYDVDAEVRFHERAGHLTVTPLRRAL